jgi:hypothetical protein
MLEHEYLVRVERAHGLPAAMRNVAEPTPGGTVYRDLKYKGFRVLVELDGEEFHPGEFRFRDRMRDNGMSESGQVTLRYGWREVTTSPCHIAAQVAGLLRDGGWGGRPRSCGPTCTAVAEFMSGDQSLDGFRSLG